MSDILNLINPEGLNYFTPDNVFAFLFVVLLIECFTMLLCNAMDAFRR